MEQSKAYGTVPLYLVQHAALHTSDVVVWAVLDAYADESRRVSMSMREIAAKTTVGHATVSAAIHRLIETGFLVMLPADHYGRGRGSAAYVLNDCGSWL